MGGVKPKGGERVGAGSPKRSRPFIDLSEKFLELHNQPLVVPAPLNRTMAYAGVGGHVVN